MVLQIYNYQKKNFNNLRALIFHSFFLLWSSFPCIFIWLYIRHSCIIFYASLEGLEIFTLNVQISDLVSSSFSDCHSHDQYREMATNKHSSFVNFSSLVSCPHETSLHSFAIHRPVFPPSGSKVLQPHTKYRSLLCDSSLYHISPPPIYLRVLQPHTLLFEKSKRKLSPASPISI